MAQRLPEALEITPPTSDDASELRAEIAEIDENLIRRNLTAAEEALAIERRAELVASLEAERSDSGATSGAIAPKVAPWKHRATGQKSEGRPEQPAGSRNLAVVQGVSEDTVRRARQRVEALGTETLEIIRSRAGEVYGQLCPETSPKSHKSKGVGRAAGGCGG